MHRRIGGFGAVSVVVCALAGCKGNPVEPAANAAPAPATAAKPAPVATPAPAATTPAPPPEPPKLPRREFKEPAATFDALAKTKTCTMKGERPAFFTSPHSPNVQDPLKLFVVSEQKIDDVTLLARGPDGKEVTLDLWRYGGPPHSIYTALATPKKGKYRFALVRGGEVTACRDVVVGTSRSGVGPVKDVVWPIQRRWSRDLENLYSAWIERMFDAPPEDRPSWTPLELVFRDPDRNFFAGYLGLKEDGPATGRETIKAEPDCADTPFFLRAYFSWKMRLPYGNYDCNRGTATTPPKCKDFFANTDPPPLAKIESPVQQFNAFLQSDVANKVQSSSGRNALKDEKTDLYPLPLERSQLRPGTVYIDPYGHLLTVAKWVDQTGDKPGMMFAVDGHPDLSVGRKRFWRGAFLFNDDYTTGGGGFKWFRPLEKVKTPPASAATPVPAPTPGVATAAGADAGVPAGPTMETVDNKTIMRSKIYGNFSLDQYKLGLDGFYDRMDAVMNPQPLDPKSAYQAVLDSLFELVLERIDSVAAGEKFHHEKPDVVFDMPEGYDMFETGGPWEDFSTPSRDHRLLTAIHVIEDFPDKVIRHPELFKIAPGTKPEGIKQDLLAQLKSFAAAKSFQYARSDGSTWTVKLSDLLMRKKGLEVAYNPNDCVELRWGAVDGTDEYKTCTRHAPKEQQDRMNLYRVWYATLKRPVRGQTAP